MARVVLDLAAVVLDLEVVPQAFDSEEGSVFGSGGPAFRKSGRKYESLYLRSRTT